LVDVGGSGFGVVIGGAGLLVVIGGSGLRVVVTVVVIVIVIGPGSGLVVGLGSGLGAVVTTVVVTMVVGRDAVDVLRGMLSVHPSSPHEMMIVVFDLVSVAVVVWRFSMLFAGTWCTSE
jgi:hypothetical protein